MPPLPASFPANVTGGRSGRECTRHDGASRLEDSQLRTHDRQKGKTNTQVGLASTPKRSDQSTITQNNQVDGHSDMGRKTHVSDRALVGPPLDGRNSQLVDDDTAPSNSQLSQPATGQTKPAGHDQPSATSRNRHNKSAGLVNKLAEGDRGRGQRMAKLPNVGLHHGPGNVQPDDYDWRVNANTDAASEAALYSRPHGGGAPAIPQIGLEIITTSPYRGAGTRGPASPTDGYTDRHAVNAMAYSGRGQEELGNTPSPTASTGVIRLTAQQGDHTQAGHNGLGQEHGEGAQLSNKAYSSYHNIDNDLHTAKIESDMELEDTDGSEDNAVNGTLYNECATTHSGQGAVWYQRPFISHIVPDNICKVYDAAVAGRGPNHSAAQVVVPSGLNIDMWDKYATGHSDDVLVLNGVRYGFPLQYTGGPKSSSSHETNSTPVPNHSSATRYPEAVDHYLAIEVEKGAMVGPFQTPPFIPWCYTSPLMSRPKPNSEERRIIVDLSFPEGGINAHIHKNQIDGIQVDHNLPTIKDALEIIHDYGADRAYMSAIDISRAYRNFRTTPEDWPLLAIFYNGQYYSDLALPFGARMSSYYMQAAARFITRALEDGNSKAIIYLDDILIVSEGLSAATKAHTRALDVLADLGLPVANKKLVPPTRKLVWLGIQIDLAENTISIPESKLEEIRQTLNQAYNMSVITTKQMQSIVGYINHLGKAVEPARLFMSRLLEALREAEGGNIHVNDQIKADLNWFRRYLPLYNGKNIIKHDQVDLIIEADACLKGFGAHNASECYSTYVTEEMASSHSISRLECINCLMAARTFIGSKHKGMTVLIRCDNEASVYTYTWGRARDRVMSACARAMWFEAATKDVTIKVVHVPGVLMTVADALSRAPISPYDSLKADNIKRQYFLKDLVPNRRLMMYSDFL